MDQPFVSGSIQTPVGIIPQVTSFLKGSDHWGSIKARWNIGRMNYTVDPGLYALGNPDNTSYVLVTANYKMSFDRLRKAMPGRNVWILVLDTKGINVWCAAGKGTFGTDELIYRIESSQLDKVVSHRQLILPQLAAPGVAAHQVKKRSGFRVIYGPVRADDLPAFINAGLNAAPEMRQKSFTLWERTVLIPVELVGALKWTAILSVIFLILSGLGGSGSFLDNIFHHGIFAVSALLSALISGAVLTPILLPWLPGRSFSFKGLYIGLITAVIVILFRIGGAGGGRGEDIEMLGWLFLIPAITAYLAMNFTGASTYTSLSGVKKEMRLAVPLEIAGGVIGFCCWLGSRFIV